MKTARYLIVACMALLFAGCSMQGEYSGEHKIIDCTDTRDGEKFTVDSRTITNVRVGIGADSCFDAVDNRGVERTLCKSHQAFLKCK